MDINALHFADIPADLPANRNGSRIVRFCDALAIGRAEAVGLLVLLYHYTPHHVGLHVRNADDGWAYEAGTVNMIPCYANWTGDPDRFLDALERAGYGKRLGAEFMVYAPESVARSL